MMKEKMSEFKKEIEGNTKKAIESSNKKTCAQNVFNLKNSELNYNGDSELLEVKEEEIKILKEIISSQDDIRKTEVAVLNDLIATKDKEIVVLREIVESQDQLRKNETKAFNDKIRSQNKKIQELLSQIKHK